MWEFPGWVPADVRHYLEHTVLRTSIRALAKRDGVHASTMMRRVHRIEARRDDVLFDAGLEHLTKQMQSPGGRVKHMDRSSVDRSGVDKTMVDSAEGEATLRREGRRILRRLCEKGAVLAVAEGLEKAVVVREGRDGASTRTAVVDNAIAQAMALREWISGTAHGKVSRYRITASGRAELNHMLAEAENAASAGFNEAQVGFDGGAGPRAAVVGHLPNRQRFSADSPLLALARRRDKDGHPFLDDALVAAGERLREDFELAQMGPNVSQNWDSFLTSGVHSPSRSGQGGHAAHAQAGVRVAAAIADLGEGLADVAFRCCCTLEGLETAEKRLGWSARSGKIVLRIALIRLREHYKAHANAAGNMIG